MYLRTLLIVLVLGVVVVFALLNWSVFTAPTTLSIGFTTFEAPLGLILLGAIGALTLLFLIYLVYLQATALMESRQYSRELKNQRELADRAEESRFTELRSSLETELRRIGDQMADSNAVINTRLDGLAHELRSAIEQSTNSLSAYIGEIEDRLERTGGSLKENPRRDL
ncbi:MAG TPA: LapA family protein [Candidatus Eisenbacteria bacterium]|nr:LapA family protein [Candidatus Eisenbacteria bacterium]